MVNSIERPGSPSSRASIDSLADSALSNLRKSLASKRAAVPKTSTTLEDRLRAAFVVGDTSSRASPATTTNPSPAAPPPSTADNKNLSQTHSPSEQLVQSPADVPLPQSPDATLQDPLGAVSVILEESTALNASDSAASVAASPLSASEDVESIQIRLRLVEQRFSDVSKSFKRLQAEKLAADSVLRELTTVESLQDSGGLRDYLQKQKQETETIKEEVGGLRKKLESEQNMYHSSRAMTFASAQDERIEELRDTHRLESRSQSDQIEQLKGQLSESEALLKATQEALNQGQGDTAARNDEINRFKVEAEKAKEFAKDEEEKRVKAISLLKTVRQKLVKAEKEKDEVAKELNNMKEKGKDEREKNQSQAGRLQKELEALKQEHENTYQQLRIRFDKEMASQKDLYEKEMAALQGQFELDAITTKGGYSKEISQKQTEISRLETNLAAVVAEKTSFFEQLQLRQAELESLQSHAELLQSQHTELQYQLRESEDRGNLLHEELAEARREQINRDPSPSASSEDLATLLAAAEAKYESRLADLQRNIFALEKERGDSEAKWSRKLREKVLELEELKKAVGSEAKSKEAEDDLVADLQQEVVRLKLALNAQELKIGELHAELKQVFEDQANAKQVESEQQARLTALQQWQEEAKNREAQLRSNNKTLRDELRKVQASAALLERQRNPGLGYWRSEGTTPAPESPTPSVASPRSSTESPESKNDEEVNLEYLRNVILQFLEHKEMRPSLVKVLSIILRFTPQETRRLIAKV